jgi:hypothetical protein
MAENHICETLCVASRYGHDECIRTLLSLANQCVNVNEKNTFGETPSRLCIRDGK